MVHLIDFGGVKEDEIVEELKCEVVVEEVNLEEDEYEFVVKEHD